MAGSPRCRAEERASTQLSSALPTSEGSSERVRVFFRKEDAINGPNTPGNSPARSYEVYSQGKFPHSQSTRQERPQSGGFAMQPIPQAHVFKDAEASNSHWIQEE